MGKPKKNALYNHQLYSVNKHSQKRFSHPRIFQHEVRRLAHYYNLPKYHGTEFRGMSNWLS